jgi:tripartite motif-containing protein 71
MASQEQLEEIVECSICLDRIQNPKVLPCQHSFCLDPCLRGTAAAHEGQYDFLRCPVCRAEHQMSYYGVDDLPTNLTLARLHEILPSRQDLTPREAPERR